MGDVAVLSHPGWDKLMLGNQYGVWRSSSLETYVAADSVSFVVNAFAAMIAAERMHVPHTEYQSWRS